MELSPLSRTAWENFQACRLHPTMSRRPKLHTALTLAPDLPLHAMLSFLYVCAEPGESPSILEASAAQARPPEQPSNLPAGTSGLPQSTPTGPSGPDRDSEPGKLSGQNTRQQGQARQLSLYAGVGIVAGSQSLSEWQVRPRPCPKTRVPRN